MIDGDSEKRRIWGKLLQARKETGYPYLMFRTNANDQAPEVFRDKGLEINSSNLCVTGDTVVDIAIDGVRKKVSIQQLNDLYQANSSIDVASFNTVTDTIEYKPVVASAMTNPTTKVLKITDTVTGYTIKCTPEHKVYTRNRGYIMAKDLKADDELVLLAN
jgi:ribonucleotide reductase alpha subunit